MDYKKKSIDSVNTWAKIIGSTIDNDKLKEMEKDLLKKQQNNMNKFMCTFGNPTDEYAKHLSKLVKNYRYKKIRSRLLRTYDYTLTKKEEKKYGDIISKYVYCRCCCSHIVSAVVERDFYPCGRCYCCAGDDPYVDSATIYISSY